MKTADFKYLIAYIIPFSGFAAVYLMGWWSFLSFVIAFGIIPLLESLLGINSKNEAFETYEVKSNIKFFDGILFLNIPIFYFLLFYTFSSVNAVPMDRHEWIGIVLSIGVIGGSAGINVAHELGHKSGKWHQLASKILLLPTLYMHFFIEHNRGHHLNVSTPKDPATSRLGEPLYFFWMRSVVRSYIHAWKLENDRLKKIGIGPLSFYNEMIQYTIAQISYLTLIFISFGPDGLLMALLVALVSFLLLETINYIEHYGLMRKILPNGRYEKVNVTHSWNSDHIIGRIMLYELTRHSDHHHKASKKYQALESYVESPQLPFGYPTSMLIALIPPLWFKIMNPKVKEVSLSA